MTIRTWNASGLAGGVAVRVTRDRGNPETVRYDDVGTHPVASEGLQPRNAMEPDTNQERREAHALLDLLPADKVNVVRNLLEVMVEPLTRSLAEAAVDDLDITPETAAALDRARTSLARGEGVPHDEIRREFGLEQ